ncbi:DUF5684 domain-containing protein [Microbacterium yannicii]|uniref:DUF5684 domain-containing protein n=1 Tax=Microbacterium yannicii TaxID=671622 RepID=UPI00031C9F84|nr:DUF5684 domain-containing protein [Microbacterium yannicii]
MNATDASAAVFGTLISLLLAAAVYVWLSLALSAVFRKSGVEAWKAWVPILNLAVLLQLGGFSPWLVLLSLVPVVNLAFVVILAIALYRVNVAFGYGVGMTVLGVLLLPLWATVIGFGSARWVGRETDASAERAAHGFDPDAGPRRMGGGRDGLPPLPSFAPPATDASGSAAASRPTLDPRVWGFAPPETSAASETPAASEPPAAPAALAAGWESGAPAAPAASAAHAVPETPPLPETYETRARPAADSWPRRRADDESDAGDAIAPEPSSAPASSAPEPVPSTVDPPEAGWTPPPMPGSRRRQNAWEGFAVDSTDHSSEVTGAFTGAPAPISAVPPVPPVPPIPALLVADDVESSGPGSAMDQPTSAPRHPPVTRVPAPAASADDGEPWAPARSPMSDTGAFADSSGAVSAVAGAPDAGAPRAARGSVSAQHARPEIPDDAFDETIISHRRRTDWSLVPPTGDPIAIGAEVVILGRRPSPDPAHPGAQLISIQDGTVSKTHARLELRGDRWFVTDLGSTNGVLFATLMGTEVEAPPGEQVEAGDRFLLGDAEVRLVRSDA